jgi:hypothetical protein
MSKEAFFSPDFPAPDEGNGFAVQPDTENLPQTSQSYCLPVGLFPETISDGGSVPENGIEWNRFPVRQTICFFRHAKHE